MSLTSEDEMISLAGEAYRDLRLDDLSSDDADTHITTVISEATDMVMSRLTSRYTEANLTNSKLVRRWATIIALYFLSQRRDNSAQYVSEYERVMEELDRVLKNEITIPGASTRADLTPSVANFQMDERHVIAKQRVLDTLSTGGTKSDRFSAEVYPSDWY